MPDAARLTSTPHAVDNTDWLKTAAIIATVFGHIGFFFTEEDGWLSVFGRFAAPILFFFLGYAQSRTIPLRRRVWFPSPTR
jgi:hypothetical protein